MNTIERRNSIEKLMPRPDGYQHYPHNAVANIKEIIALIKNEPSKKQQFEYFKKLMLKVTDFMGTLAFETWNNHKKVTSGASGHNRTEVLGMLRALKKLHFDIDYTPGCMRKINTWIGDMGGTVQTRAQMQEKKNERLRAAAEKLKAGEKMPRKKKKSILGMLRQGNQK